MRLRNVLSVDWDFFFPDVWQFDWGHREEPLFLEVLWAVRPGSRSLETAEVAIDVVHPDEKLLDGFWEKVVGCSPQLLVVVDSHADMHKVLGAWGGTKRLVNFDQHHDLGYASDMTGTLNCGNWVTKAVQNGLLEKYELWYPPWRKGKPEGEIDGRVEPKYGLPKKPEKFDCVFICRSSAWSPSWSDDRWIEFVEYWKARAPRTWRMRLTCDFAQKVREPNLEQALVLRDEYVEQMKELMRDHRRSHGR